MRYALLAILIALCCASGASAAVSVKADVDRDQVDMSGQVVLTVTITGDTGEVGEPQLPPLPDFVSVGTGSRQNLVISGGQVSKSLSYTYSLMPRKTGTLVIAPVTVPTSTGDVQTRPITITVTQAPPPTPRRNDASGTGRGDRRRTAEPFFVRAEVDRDTVYLGQQLTYTFSFYRSISISETNNYTPPQTTGFISVDLPPQRKRTTMIDGETYSVVQVVTAMFPTRTGVMTIGPARLRVVPDMISNLMGRDPLGWLRGSNRAPLTAGEPRNLATQAFEIYVKPLPPEPASHPFSGAVGTCRLAAEISADSAAVGDPVTIAWTLDGVGRKDVVDAPRMDWPDGLEVFPPTTELTTSTRNDLVRETKTFSIAVVPRKEGIIEIPAPELTYFNPDNARYETARGRALTLKVGPPRPGMALSATTQTISAASSSIRYLKAEPDVWESTSTGGSAFRFILLQLTMPLLVAVLVVWKRRTEAPEQRARGARQKQIRFARKRITTLAADMSPRQLADEVSAAFRLYLAARFELAPGEMVGAEWRERLLASGCGAAEAQEAERILRWSDETRFGGGTGNRISPAQVLELMNRLDRCVSS